MRNGQVSIDRRIAEIDRWGWDREFGRDQALSRMHNTHMCLSECECMRVLGLWNLIVNGARSFR